MMMPISTMKHDKRPKDGDNIVKLSRDDLIAFAILTGSDLAGDGLSKVGCRKAIRFIRKCQMDNPLKMETCSPAMEELLSWEEVAKASTTTSKTSTADNTKNDTSCPTCSCCGHAGNKRSHKKDGCEGCGTGPGESCFHLSPGGKFRKHIRSKALEMKAGFNPTLTAKTYHNPNENQLPAMFAGQTARTLEMKPPRLQDFLKSSLIVRGNSLYESRNYVQKSLATYIARTELFNKLSGRSTSAETSKLPKNYNRPVPVRVSKLMVRAGKASCEVQWIIKASMTDAEGNPIDEFEFSTIEDENMIRKCYPKLLDLFKEEKTRMEQQGTSEQDKRQTYLDTLFALTTKESKEDIAARPGSSLQLDGKKKSLTRGQFFEQGFVADTTERPKSKSQDTSSDLQNVFEKMKEIRTKKRSHQQTDQAKFKIVDITNILHDKARLVKGTEPNPDTKPLFENLKNNIKRRDDASTIESGCPSPSKNLDIHEPVNNLDDYADSILTPGHVHFLRYRNLEQEGVVENKDKSRANKQSSGYCNGIVRRSRDEVATKGMENGNEDNNDTIRNIHPKEFPYKREDRFRTDEQRITVICKGQQNGNRSESRSPLLKRRKDELQVVQMGQNEDIDFEAFEHATRDDSRVTDQIVDITYNDSSLQIEKLQPDEFHCLESDRRFNRSIAYKEEKEFPNVHEMIAVGANIGDNDNLHREQNYHERIFPDNVINLDDSWSVQNNYQMVTNGPRIGRNCDVALESNDFDNFSLENDNCLHHEREAYQRNRTEKQTLPTYYDADSMHNNLKRDEVLYLEDVPRNQDLIKTLPNRRDDVSLLNDLEHHEDLVGFQHYSARKEGRLLIQNDYDNGPDVFDEFRKDCAVHSDTFETDCCDYSQEITSWKYDHGMQHEKFDNENRYRHSSRSHDVEHYPRLHGKIYSKSQSSLSSHQKPYVFERSLRIDDHDEYVSTKTT